MLYGNLYFRREAKGLPFLHPINQAQRIFYMPAYRTEAEKRSPVPDFRHTLLWRPDIRTAGESSISIPFTTSDLTGDFTITIEGLTQTGEALYATEQFQVK